MSLEGLTSELYQSYQAENYNKCHSLLPKIKLELIKHHLLVPQINLQSNISKQQINDLKITKKILEIGALSSLYLSDFEQFEKYLIQLKPFYLNSKITNLKTIESEDDETTKLISLNLLYFLSRGLISKFHVELEILYNQSNLKIDNFLQFPINLEKNLMEGNYIKIWKLLNQSSNFPCKEFSFFSDTLIDALRFEISNSIEKTYIKLPVSNFKNLLYFNNSNFSASDLNEFINMHENWSLRDGFIYFKNDEDLDIEGNSELIIKNALNYASEIETIV